MIWCLSVCCLLSNYSCIGLVVIFFGISEGNLNASVALILTASIGIVGYAVTRAQLAAFGKSLFCIWCFLRFFDLVSTVLYVPFVKTEA